MEILTSLITGAFLMEIYALLDLLANWMIRRAALQLDEEDRSTFIDMVTADVDALPNSFAKLAFVFRNCTLAMRAIRDEIYRETLHSVTEATDDFLESRSESFEHVLARADELTQYCVHQQGKLITTIESALERLQQRGVPAAQIEIDQFGALGINAIGQFGNFRVEFESYRQKLHFLASDLQSAYMGVSEINLRLKQRLAEDRPIDDNDVELLLQEFSKRLDAVNHAINKLANCDLPRQLNTSWRDALKAATESYKVADRAVKQQSRD